MTKKRIFFITIISLLIVFGSGIRIKNDDQVAYALAQIDCTADNPNCPQLVISGDAPDKSKFHGFADPSMRRDPNTGILWLAYSWPHVVKSQRRTFFSRPTLAVDIHLAQSKDNGRTWTYAGPLWQAHSVINPATKAKNINSHEVANIWPQNQNGKTNWYGISWDYLIKPGSTIYSQIGRYSYFSLSMASLPEQLANAPSQMLGFKMTANRLSPDIYLSSLHPELSSCMVWNEPALITQGDRLYLAARCMHFEGIKLIAEKDFYAIFSTEPRGNIKKWQWQYHGKLAGPKEAADLDNHQFLTQFDFAQKTNGTLLAVLTTADTGGPQGELYSGCRVLQISSLDPPALTRDAKGKLIVLGKLTAADSISTGTAACAYEPSSETGIIMTRKLIGDPVKGYYWTLHKTGLKP